MASAGTRRSARTSNRQIDEAMRIMDEVKQLFVDDEVDTINKALKRGIYSPIDVLYQDRGLNIDKLTTQYDGELRKMLWNKHDQVTSAYFSFMSRHPKLFGASMTYAQTRRGGKRRSKKGRKTRSRRN